MSSYTDLVKRYDVPVPRYTSYPTVPHWQVKEFSLNEWKEKLKVAFDASNTAKGISLYLHLPFCESLCTYCACNTRITKNHKVEDKYIHALLEEWNIYKAIFGGTVLLRELHVGGGTPTFFSPQNLHRLLTSILEGVLLHPQFEFSLEGHPNNTMDEHLEVLQQCGFKRISFGVQDLSEKVQKAIHRIQPFENVKRVVEQSRARGFDSISFDLVYGLPFQTPESVEDTMKQVLSLRPDRLSFYSYAHVPWLKPGQRGYEDADLPGDVRKRSLYETGRNILTNAGYREIGMDHFALPHDTLAIAQAKGELHRNFMGYTTTHTDMLIGLGASSISETIYGYAQNEKSVEDYEALVSEGSLPIVKGHLQKGEDALRKQVILAISCQGFVPYSLLQPLVTDEVESQLEVMQNEGLVLLQEEGLRVMSLGKTFIRNICSVFDKYRVAIPGEQLFSKAI